MKVPENIRFKLLHPRGREQSLDKRLTRPLREPEIRSRLWPWILLAGLLFLASMVAGQPPLQGSLFQNLHGTATEVGTK